MYAKEIVILKAQGFQPCIDVLSHCDGINDDVLPCCKAARAAFCSEVIAASKSCEDGIKGVLLYLQRNFHWGLKRCTFMCEMMQYSHELDCGAGMGIALLALHEYIQHVQSFSSRSFQANGNLSDLRLCAIQLVRRCDPANNRFIQQVLRSKQENPATSTYCEWMTENLVYHQCVGMYSTTSKHLHVWDYPGWCHYDEHNQCPDSAIMSIRATPCHASNDPTPDRWVLWDEKLFVPFGHWVDLPEVSMEDSDLRRERQCTDRIARTLYAPNRPVDDAQKLCDSVGAMFVPIDRPRGSTIPSVMVSITACHMSSAPLPGLGVARSLRSWLASKSAWKEGGAMASDMLALQYMPDRLVVAGVDDMQSDPLCGLTDPCLDIARDITALGEVRQRSSWSHNTDAKSDESEDLHGDVLWNEFVAMANVSDPDVAYSFVIPCIDSDVGILSRRMSQELQRLSILKKEKGMRAMSRENKERNQQIHQTCMRILCPSTDALAWTSKPDIPVVSVMPIFQIPEYMMVKKPCQGSSRASDISVLLSEVQCFCDRVGYPVLVKGERHGAQLCAAWSSVVLTISQLFKMGTTDGQSCFVQRYIKGTEKTIAFAAIRGELTGCMLMTKTISTATGKVWTGIVSPVSATLMKQLQTFVATCKWTGGGELEFLETIPNGLDQEKPGAWYLIDFNPRFPAWISACCYTGCNLPADMVAHAIMDEDKRSANPDESHVLADSSLVQRNLQRYMSFRAVSFAKSVIEVPLDHYDIGKHSLTWDENQSKGMHKAQARNGANTTDISMEERASVNNNNGRTNGIDMDELDHHRLISRCTMKHVPTNNPNDLSMLLSAIDTAIDKHTIQRTPTYVVSQNLIRSALQRHEQFVQQALDAATKDLEKVHHQSSNLECQLCVSIKTQPLPTVLRAAREMGYLAECISLAEVRAAYEAGFPPEKIVLTGPGKSWEASGMDCQAGGLQELWNKDGGFCFAAVFADSLMDLYTIIQHLCPTNKNGSSNGRNRGWRCNLLGLRFQPSGHHSSRFGLNGNDPLVLRLAASMVRHLVSSDIKIGIHLHFAASAPYIGPTKWMGIAQATVSLATSFGELCGRPVEVIDFGGGWAPNWIEEPSAMQEMTNLMAYAARANSTAMSNSHPSVSVQFELGKCISERAGAMVCRVLAIREIEMDSTDLAAMLDRWEDDADGLEAALSTLPIRKRAIIVDGSIGEISSPHVHSIFWRPSHSDDDPTMNGSPSSGPNNSHEWRSFVAGKDEIWGRTCMEFDQLIGVSSTWGTIGGRCGMGQQLIQVPPTMKPGDFIAIANCGAYDMSMQYDFGDGEARRHCIVI